MCPKFASRMCAQVCPGAPWIPRVCARVCAYVCVRMHACAYVHARVCVRVCKPVATNLRRELTRERAADGGRRHRAARCELAGRAALLSLSASRSPRRSSRRSPQRPAVASTGGHQRRSRARGTDGACCERGAQPPPPVAVAQPSSHPWSVSLQRHERQRCGQRRGGGITPDAPQ